MDFGKASGSEELGILGKDDVGFYGGKGGVGRWFQDGLGCGRVAWNAGSLGGFGDGIRGGLRAIRGSGFSGKEEEGELQNFRGRREGFGWLSALDSLTLSNDEKRR